MAYLDKDDLVNYYDSRDIVMLTDDTGALDYTDTDNINETIVNLAIEQASYTIENHLRHFYTDIGNGDSPTPEIKKICADLAMAFLYRRRGRIAISKGIEEDARMRLHKMVIENPDEVRDAASKATSKRVDRRE